MHIHIYIYIYMYLYLSIYIYIYTYDVVQILVTLIGSCTPYLPSTGAQTEDDRVPQSSNRKMEETHPIFNIRLRRAV